ncbi:RusA family crossover junction endodeoxyribonuclease [Nitrosarchaeum sp.]|uniref:RusA family crossover junction endodeoxyribonuclease n=1 Tax=Nitrosarchaeum sp. TaxID=2026886 RepID=UPI00247E2DA1|nr:RusA family crossover junction endodeoxyribonuclease [Nitrosarchaeum sp.]MCV0411386.1 RusA family crossover junction endodeoxyribonuclease [Nitrosarchaeum sp.]
MKSKNLGTLIVKPFQPMTAKSQEEVTRKKDLRDFIIDNISNLSDVKNSCKDIKTVSVEVCFNLYNGEKNDTSRFCKDLDNLLKIVLDVLADYMDNKTENREFGLGIIRNDNQVSEIYSYKKFVQDPNLEGIDITIFEWND